MNSGFRKQEILRITLENEALLKRIQSKKSHISNKKLLYNEMMRKKYLSNCCEYPVTLYSNNGNKEDSISKEKLNGLREQSKVLEGGTLKNEKKFRITSNSKKKHDTKQEKKTNLEPDKVFSLQKNTLRIMGDLILVDASKVTKGNKEKKIVVSFSSISTDEKLKISFDFDECKGIFLVLNYFK
jgi:hypothetical protein